MLVHQSMAQGDPEEDESLRLDVFTRLILANEMEGKYPLSESELVSLSVLHCPSRPRSPHFKISSSHANQRRLVSPRVWSQDIVNRMSTGSVYLLLLAGHDTTSGTISAACALLAAHPEAQAKVYEEVESLGEDWTFGSYSKLRYTLQTFVEASRLYPAGFLSVRAPVEDALLRIPPANSTCQPSQVALRKDSAVCVDYIGVREYKCLLLAVRLTKWPRLQSKRVPRAYEV